MKDYTDSNYHFTGTFNVDGDEITGELIYNKENGMILLRLIKLLDDIFIPAKSYGVSVGQK